MTLLNSLSLDNALSNTQQNIHSAANAATTETTTTATSTTATTSATTESQQDTAAQRSRKTVALSDRAQKIQKLNEEFFQGGPRSVRISDTLIERLREYGFLDAQESNQLLNTLNSNKQQEDSTVGQLADFVAEFRDTLGESEIEQSLAATLNKTHSILDNLDGTRPSALSSDITTVAAELKQYLNSDQATDLSSHQRSQLQQVSLALKIADSLNPENLSSSKVNRYLNVLGGSY